MVPFGIPLILRHRTFRVPKRDHNLDNHPYYFLHIPTMVTIFSSFSSNPVQLGPPRDLLWWCNIKHDNSTNENRRALFTVCYVYLYSYHENRIHHVLSTQEKLQLYIAHWVSLYEKTVEVSSTTTPSWISTLKPALRQEGTTAASPSQCA